MLRFGFSGKKDRDPQAVERIKATVRAALVLHQDVAISVNEIACADPACPILETIILVMEPGRKTKAYKAHGGLEAMGVDEVKAALVGG